MSLHHCGYIHWRSQAYRPCCFHFHPYVLALKCVQQPHESSIPGFGASYINQSDASYRVASRVSGSRVPRTSTHKYTVRGTQYTCTHACTMYEIPRTTKYTGTMYMCVPSYLVPRSSLLVLCTRLCTYVQVRGTLYVHALQYLILLRSNYSILVLVPHTSTQYKVPRTYVHGT